MATRKALTPLTSPKPFTGFVAVRHSADGYDWLDAATVSGLREETERLVTYEAVVYSLPMSSPLC
jgi:hypothetical protein